MILTPDHAPNSFVEMDADAAMGGRPEGEAVVHERQADADGLPPLIVERRVCAGDVLRNLLLARPKDEAVAAKCLSVCVQLGFVRVCDGKLEAVPGT